MKRTRYTDDSYLLHEDSDYEPYGLDPRVCEEALALQQLPVTPSEPRDDPYRIFVISEMLRRLG